LPAILAGMIRRHGRAAERLAVPQASDPFGALPRHFLVWGTLLLVVRCAHAALRPYDHKTHSFPTHLRMDSLMFGVVLAYWSAYHRAWLAEAVRRLRWPLAACALGLLVPPFLVDLGQSAYHHTVGFTACYLGSGALLLLVVHAQFTPGPLVRAAARLGAYSYSIYLWHLAVRLWGVPHLEQALGVQFSFLPATAAYMLGSVLVGVSMASLIENPALALRDRLYPSRSKPAIVPDAEKSSCVSAVPARRAA